MFLIDKYRPQNEKDKNIFFHKDLIKLLSIMSKDEAIPHIIFYGPDGSGKKSIINIFLEMLFDDSVHKLKDVSYDVVGSGNKTTKEKVKQSNYHIVIEPKNNGYDRCLIYYIVKEYAKRKSLGVFKTNRQFKLVLLNNIDNLSYYAQTSLRRTMERYDDKCRFVMCCNSLTGVINPLQSRCICMRVPSPTDSEMFAYLFKLSVHESVNLSLPECSKIVKRADGNIKKVLWELQFRKFGYKLETNYYTSIKKLVSLLLSGNLKNMQEIRDTFFKLTITNFTGTTILKDMIDLICMDENLSDIIKQQIIQKVALTQYQLTKGRREIIHFDSFITNTMMILNTK